MIKQLNFIIVTNSFRRDIALVERNLKHSLSQKPSPQKVIFIDQNEKKLELPSEISQSLLLQHLHIPKQSVSAARNSLNISPETEWIIFCDDDGYLMEGYAEKFIETAKSHPEVEIVAGSIIRDDNGEFYTSRHRIGGDINKFPYAKLLMGSNFACKAKTFKKLNRFDERLGAGAFWGSGEETDFAWKAHFAGVPMLYCSELKVFHVKPYSSTFPNNLKKAFFYGRGKGALVAKWIFEEKKLKPFYEMAEMSVVPVGQIFKAVLTFHPKEMVIYFTVLLARLWGFILFGVKFLFFRGR